MTVANSEDAGFTATVLVSARPDEVFSYFTHAPLFARWFVVDGFTTPEGEIELDLTPGGAISGVMVSDDGSSRIPFQLRYGRLDPPHLVQFLFEEADEAVTLDVQPADAGRTRVSYHKPYGSADAVHGAQSMLDALAASIAEHAPTAEHAADSAPASPPQQLEGLAKLISLPVGFFPPTELTYSDLRAHAISRADLDDDVAGINASLDLIRRTRGGQWPTEPVTAEGNYIDLVWHECEFRDGKSFTYAVFHEDGAYLGCCYFYPVGTRVPLSAELLRHDVDVSWWVTPDAYEAGHYETLYAALRDWAGTAFPFTNPYFSNREVPVVVDAERG
jgi:uncharacterized protein YndB with AHSA1/START domain